MNSRKIAHSHDHLYEHAFSIVTVKQSLCTLLDTIQLTNS